MLKANGILFSGIDMIGSCITEINLTSPTMIQQIYRASGIDCATLLIDVVDKMLR